MPLDFRFPDFCSYLRQIISPVSRVAIIITQMSQCSQMCQGCPASVTGRGQNYCSRFSVSFPLVILGTFVAGVPVCLLLTHSPSHTNVENVFGSVRISRSRNLCPSFKVMSCLRHTILHLSLVGMSSCLSQMSLNSLCSLRRTEGA